MAHSPYDMMISLSFDGHLSPEEERDLRQHLQPCDMCASAWRRMTLLDAMFSHPVNAPAPADTAVAATPRAVRPPPGAR